MLFGNIFLYLEVSLLGDQADDRGRILSDMLTTSVGPMTCRILRIGMSTVYIKSYTGGSYENGEL